MFRLRCALTPQLGLQLRREVLLARRHGLPVFRPVGYGVTLTPSVLSSVRSFSSFSPRRPWEGARTVSTAASMAPTATPAAAVASCGMGSRFTTLWTAQRTIRTAKKDGAEGEKAETDNNKNNNDDDSTKRTGEEEEEAKQENENNEGKDGDKGKKNQQKKKKGGKGRQKPRGILDQIRLLREDYLKFPDIYNSANAINFIVFSVFCLCSTGSSSEEKWWMTQWGVDNTFHPLSWFLHSFLTNNFLSMTYAMMLLHTMCHTVLPTLGSRGLLLYIALSATLSGAIMWLFNRQRYGPEVDKAPEKQFGPWDVVSALFVMQYCYYGITPIMTLNSFNGWIRYACWVGEVCILYFDWQPTFVGALVGVALCKGVPRFRNVKIPGA